MENMVKKRVNNLIRIFLILALVFSAKYVYDSVSCIDSSQVEKQEQNDDNISDLSASKNVIYILFLGIDKRSEKDVPLRVYRTDTMALARIDFANTNIDVLSIPRDTYTFVPIENKMDKINHAYAYGSLEGNGVQASIDAVNRFLNQNVVDYYFVMDMEPIPAIVDEIGGISMDVEIDMKGSGVDLTKGFQVLNGKQAYDYISWRDSPRGDIDRIKRQQKFMSVLFKQQRDSGKLLETLQIIEKYKNHMQTNLNVIRLIELATFMSAVNDESDTYYTIEGTGKEIDEIDYWIPDQVYTEQVLKEYFQ
jgi:LCP family protein required for cell wall assembly